MFTCQICKKNFRRKDYLEKHKQRKNPCKPVNFVKENPVPAKNKSRGVSKSHHFCIIDSRPITKISQKNDTFCETVVNETQNECKPENEPIYKCEYCNKKYRHKQNKYRHLKTCKEKIKKLKEEEKVKKILKKLEKENKTLVICNNEEIVINKNNSISTNLNNSNSTSSNSSIINNNITNNNTNITNNTINNNTINNNNIIQYFPHRNESIEKLMKIENKYNDLQIIERNSSFEQYLESLKLHPSKIISLYSTAIFNAHCIAAKTSVISYEPSYTKIRKHKKNVENSYALIKKIRGIECRKF